MTLFMKPLTWYLVFAMILISIVPRADAGFSPSELTSISTQDRAKDLSTIQKALESKAIKKRLEDLGFSADEINNRLSQLDDHQIHWLAKQLDEMKVGGDGLGVIIALLVIVILVVILLQITGHRIIVTK